MLNEKKLQVPGGAKGIYITATGTDAGKTYISALILKKLKADGIDCAYYKPVMSGVLYADGEEQSDLMYIRQAVSFDEQQAFVSYSYKTAVSPHLAARLEGSPPELSRIVRDWQEISAAHDFTVVEGAGGIVCPFRFDAGTDGGGGSGGGTSQAKRSGCLLLQEDVIKALGLDVIIVSGCALGSINSAVLSAAYAQQKKIRVRGFILNRFRGGLMEEDNRQMIEKLTGLPVIAVVEEGSADEASLKN